jgi:urease gamma subunit
VNLKDPKLVAATKKSQSGQQLNPQEKEMMAAAGAAAVAMQKESRLGRRRLRESELQSAQVVLAAQDMIDRIQKMLEEVSEMQFKDLPALTDSIKNDMGIDQATQFQSASAAALTQLLQSLQQGKTQMEAAQGTLTGQAPVVPGQDPMAAPADPNMDPNMDAELDLNVDADIEPADDEEEPTPLGGAGLGRERR